MHILFKTGTNFAHMSNQILKMISLIGGTLGGANTILLDWIVFRMLLAVAHTTPQFHHLSNNINTFGLRYSSLLQSSNMFAIPH